jgi:Domain of unknown function (DUF932)/Cytochrome c
MFLRRIFPLVGLVLCLAAFGEPQQKQIKRIPAKLTSPASGQEMYTSYCAVCHGTDGRGGGPAAEALKVPPSDLTTLACKNGGKYHGLLVAEAEIKSIIVRHTGDILRDVVTGSQRLTEDAGKALGTVKKWQQLQLTDGERHAFATAAHTLRFADPEGKTTTPITPDQLLVPRRREDIGNELWRTFNVAQENVIAGGLSAIKRDENGRRVRRVSTRQIKGIDQDTNLNRALWTLGLRDSCNSLQSREIFVIPHSSY